MSSYSIALRFCWEVVFLDIFAPLGQQQHSTGKQDITKTITRIVGAASGAMVAQLAALEEIVVINVHFSERFCFLSQKDMTVLSFGFLR